MKKCTIKKITAVLIALIIGCMSVGLAEEESSLFFLRDKNDRVTALHEKLTELGFYHMFCDIEYSIFTEIALRKLQEAMGWEKTGKVRDEEELEKIMKVSENDPVFAIKKISAIDEYLDYIREKKLTVFISICDEASKKLKESTMQKFEALGLAHKWKDMYRKAYVAVLNENEVVQEIAASVTTGAPIKVDGIVGNIHYVVLSAGHDNDGGSNSSIVLNEKEYSRKGRGINIVVADKGRVIDSVTFDTWGEDEAEAKR